MAVERELRDLSQPAILVAQQSELLEPRLVVRFGQAAVRTYRRPAESEIIITGASGHLGRLVAERVRVTHRTK